MAPICPVVQQQSYWETLPRNCALHSVTAFQLPTQVSVYSPITQEFLPRQLFPKALDPSPSSM